MNITKDIQWQLPTHYDADVRSKISWDAQIYLQCLHCGREHRIDATFSSVAEDPSKARCHQCGEHGLALSRHLETYLYQCQECQHSQEGVTDGFEELRCSSCGSKSIHVLGRRIEPPFPKTFDDFMTQKDNPWGMSAEEDLMRVLEEFQYTNMLPEKGLHAQIYSRFCKRLRLYSEYSPVDASRARNAEGQILKEYFRLSGDLAAGIECIRISEECVATSTDRLTKALMEHNVAMEIYSVLVRFPEALLESMTGRKQIRRDGIRAAEQALEGVRAEMSEWPQYDAQVARILHILGDLLRIDEASPLELRRAVDCFTEALDIPNLDSRTRANISESRALAITSLPDAKSDELKLAINDLESSAKRNEESRAWAERWTALANLGSLYLSFGELNNAISRYEQAAALVLHDLDKSINENELQYKGGTYVRVMEGLARAYVQSGKHEKALDAIETLRAATLRLQTMSEQERERRMKSAGAAVVKDSLRVIFGGKPSHVEVRKLKLESSAEKLEDLWEGVADTPTCFVTYSVSMSVVTCVIAFPSRKGGLLSFGNKRWTVKSVQWKLPEEKLKFLSECVTIDSMPLRAQYLERSRKSLHEAFVDPLLPLVKDDGIERIGISTPGLLSHLPFDCFGADDYFIHSFDLFQLPSLTVGTDLIKRRSRAKREPRLLLVEYAGQDLPHAQREVQALREIWGGAVDIIPASRDSKAQVLKALNGDYSFIHFACHANFDLLDPLESALFVAGMDRPTERITAKDITKVHLAQSPVITLSACSSALTSYGQANDCVGIPGSLLRAGARGIVGARWSVYDDAAANFMIEYHQRLRSEASHPLSSLCQTKRHLSQRTRLDEWAAFGYLGVP